MSGFRRFEDILAWQKARVANKLVYKITTKGEFSRDFDLRSQIRRASISIMANIAEGYGRHSDKEFANFLNIAHASSYEVQSHLYAALDLDYINEAEFDSLYSAFEEVNRMTFALSKKLRG